MRLLVLLLFVSFQTIAQPKTVTSSKIVIVNINNPTPEKIATVLEFVSKQDPKVIGLDINLDYQQLKDPTLLPVLLKSKNLVVGLKSTNHRFYKEFKDELKFGVNEFELKDDNFSGYAPLGHIGQEDTYHLTWEMMKLYDNKKLDSLKSTINGNLSNLRIGYDLKNIDPMFMTIEYEQLDDVLDDACTDQIVLIGQSVFYNFLRDSVTGENAIKTGRKDKNYQTLYRTTLHAIILQYILNEHD